MKLNQLRALAAVAETGSIQEASRILHLTQPALSKAIKELESSVGATLFVRSSKGVQLTPFGQRLVSHARLISENVRRAREDLEDMKGTVQSEITVGVTPVTALMRPMAACLSTFRREFPNARLRVLEMRPAQLLEHLREGTMDFAVTSQLLPLDRGLDCTQVCRLPTMIGARRGHALRAARSVRVLQQADAIWLDEIRKAGLYDTIWQAFAVLLPVKTVGVMGDARTYENVCALRAVTSTDGMTADFFEFPWEVLGRAATRIVNEVKGVNRVVYDITSKPPGTIEWE